MADRAGVPSGDVLALQRAVGNRAVGSLLRRPRVSTAGAMAVARAGNANQGAATAERPNPLVLPQEYVDMPMELGGESSTERGARRDAQYFWPSTRVSTRSS